MNHKRRRTRGALEFRETQDAGRERAPGIPLSLRAGEGTGRLLAGILPGGFLRRVDNGNGVGRA